MKFMIIGFFICLSGCSDPLKESAKIENADYVLKDIPTTPSYSNNYNLPQTNKYSYDINKLPNNYSK